MITKSNLLLLVKQTYNNVNSYLSSNFSPSQTGEYYWPLTSNSWNQFQSSNNIDLTIIDRCIMYYTNILPLKYITNDIVNSRLSKKLKDQFEVSFPFVKEDIIKETHPPFSHKHYLTIPFEELIENYKCSVDIKKLEQGNDIKLKKNNYTNIKVSSEIETIYNCLKNIEFYFWLDRDIMKYIVDKYIDNIFEDFKIVLDILPTLSQKGNINDDDKLTNLSRFMMLGYHGSLLNSCFLFNICRDDSSFEEKKKEVNIMFDLINSRRVILENINDWNTTKGKEILKCVLSGINPLYFNYKSLSPQQINNKRTYIINNPKKDLQLSKYLSHDIISEFDKRYIGWLDEIYMHTNFSFKTREGTLLKSHFKLFESIIPLLYK